MSLSKTAAGVFGAAYLLVGIVGFVPIVGGSYTIDPSNLLGLFAVNAVHNVVHIGVGVLGLAAYSQGASASRMFAQAIGSVYALLAIAGIFFGTGNLLGLVPIGGLDILLHATTAVVLLYVGFSRERQLTAEA